MSRPAKWGRRMPCQPSMPNSFGVHNANAMSEDVEPHHAAGDEALQAKSRQREDRESDQQGKWAAWIYPLPSLGDTWPIATWD